MTTLGEQFGLTGDNIIVEGPKMHGAWIALDDIPGDLPGGVYEFHPDTGALRELPAEQPPAAHPSPKELSMSSSYYDTSTGRPVELADPIPGAFYDIPRAPLTNQDRLRDYAAEWSRQWAANEPQPAPEGYVEIPESGESIAARQEFLRRAHGNGHARALEARSGVSAYAANDPDYYGEAEAHNARLYRHASGQPIMGRDGRPQFEDDGAAAGGDKIGPTDGRRGSAEAWIADQRRRGSIR